MKNALTIVSIGYHGKFAFNDMQTAIQFFQLVGQSIPLDSNYGELPDGRKGVVWIREDSPHLALEQVSADKVELEFTKEQLRARAEAKDDVESTVRLVDVSTAPREIEYTESTVTSTEDVESF